MRLIVMPGDGIGPEIIGAAVDVMSAADTRYGLGLSYDYEDAGFASLEKHGTTLRQEVLERAKDYDGVILGTQSHNDYPPPEEGGRNISASFRVGLDLYAKDFHVWIRGHRMIAEHVMPAVVDACRD